MFTPEYPILTDRLSLRRLSMRDLDTCYAIQSREDVARYMYWEPRTRSEARELLAQRVGHYRLDELNEELSIGVDLTETGEMVGTALLKWTSRSDEQGELGYVLHPDHHGHGYGTELAIALLRLGFEDVKMHRIIGRCDGRNTASAHVMEKAGMRREAHFRENEWVKGEWTDELVYAMLADEWIMRS